MPAAVAAAEAVDDYADEDVRHGTDALQLTSLMTTVICWALFKTVEKTVMIMRMHDALNAYCM